MKVEISENPVENLNLRLIAENTDEEANAFSLLRNGSAIATVKFSGKNKRGTAKEMKITLLFKQLE